MGRLENLKPFQVGHPGGPGRPKGSRAKLSELAATLLYENFTVNGAETIERVRLRKPEVYLASVIALLPKQAQKVESPFVDISDAELEALEQHLAAVRAKMVRDIEATVEPSPAPTRAADMDVMDATDSVPEDGVSAEGDGERLDGRLGVRPDGPLDVRPAINVDTEDAV